MDKGLDRLSIVTTMVDMRKTPQHSRIGETVLITQPEVATKAVGMVAGHKVTIINADDSEVWGTVQGSKSYPYTVYWNKLSKRNAHSRGSCSCRATTVCSHIMALLLADAYNHEKRNA